MGLVVLLDLGRGGFMSDTWIDSAALFIFQEYKTALFIAAGIG